MRKKSNVVGLITIILAVIIGIMGVILYMTNSKLKETELERVSLETEIEENTQTVYVAMRDISKGEILTTEGEEANLERQTICTGLEPYNYIDANSIGCVATIDIGEGIPIMYNMVTSNIIGTDERFYEISVVELLTNQDNHDYIDVRIVFPNGEDYIVLAKKQIQDLNLENCVFQTNLNEEEILRMASAIIDAYTITGTRLYVTKYIESTLQEPSTPTYLVRTDTIDIINHDVNVITKAVETLNAKARLELENKLLGISEENLSAVAEGWNLHDTAKGSVLLEGGSEEDTGMMEGEFGVAETDDITKIAEEFDDVD